MVINPCDVFQDFTKSSRPNPSHGDEAKQEDSRKKQFQGDLAWVVVIPDPVISLFGF